MFIMCTRQSVLHAYDCEREMVYDITSWLSSLDISKTQVCRTNKNLKTHWDLTSVTQQQISQTLTQIIWDYVVCNENLQTSASNGECLLQSLTFIRSSVKKKSDNRSDSMKFHFQDSMNFESAWILIEIAIFHLFTYKRIIYKNNYINIFMYAL